MREGKSENEIGQKEKAKLNMWRILKEVKKKLSWKKSYWIKKQ